MGNRIRALRQRKGWSQAELAERAGVTRQQIGSVEAGRHLPNVDAAMALARALGSTVEELFAAVEPPLIELAVASGTDGDRLAATAAVGDRVVAVAPRGRSVEAERWFVADVVFTDTGVEWLPGARTDGLVLAGCDPVMGMLAELVERSSSRRILAQHATTARAAAALERGTIHGAVVHARPGELPVAPAGVRRWRIARWQVGLAAPGDRPPPPVEDLVERDLSVAQREEGAGSQLALVRALETVGCDHRPRGPVAGGHLDAARRVELGQADIAVTMEAAASAHHLAFAPLEAHEVELWIDERWADHAASAALLDMLTSAAFLRRVRCIGGYDVSQCGTAAG